MSLKDQKGLRLVPFNGVWINHDKIDIHAIYERPRYVQDEYGEWEREVGKDGLLTWDLTGPLPVKSHTKWITKGFRYVTLADSLSLMTAAQQGSVKLQDGMSSWREYLQHQTGGPWNYKKYAEGIKDSHTAEASQLREDVLRFGAEAVEQIHRRLDPAFVLSKELRALGTPQPEPEVTAAPDVQPLAEAAHPNARPHAASGKFVKREVSA